MKYLGLAVLAVVAMFVVVVNFSAVESRYQCDGEITLDGQSKPMTVFMKLHEYRWWVGLWSDSDAAVWIEIPNALVNYFFHVNALGDNFYIHQASSGTRVIGSFSRLSKSLAINTELGDFEGACKSIKDDR